MTVLITGANGFIGRHLIDRLLKEPSFGEIICVGRSPYLNYAPGRIKSYAFDLGETNPKENDFHALDTICKTHKPETIFHLAGKATVKEASNPYKIIQDNIISTQKVIHAAPQGCRVVLASTVIVYGDWWTGDLTKPESTFAVIYCDEDLATIPTSTYGITKRASESLIEAYTNMGNINGVSARLCATVGSGVTHGVIKDFIRKLKNDNPNLEALGAEPGSTKPYCHIDDTIGALMLLAKSEEIGAYNVAPDDSINIAGVAKAVMKGCGIEKPIKWLGEGANWKGDNRIISVSNMKLKNIGWKLKYPKSTDAIEDAVKKIEKG